LLFCTEHEESDFEQFLCIQYVIKKFTTYFSLHFTSRLNQECVNPGRRVPVTTEVPPPPKELASCRPSVPRILRWLPDFWEICAPMDYLNFGPVCTSVGDSQFFMQLDFLKERFCSLLRHTYLLTPWSRVLLERLTGSAASQEISRIFGTRRFLTVLTNARHLSLS
jgi:hypothetical protein